MGLQNMSNTKFPNFIDFYRRAKNEKY